MKDFSNLIKWNKLDLPVKSGIYLIENTINKKIYIGQAQNIKKRILSHFTSKEDTYFHRALHKYSEENFNIYILEYCEVSELDSREIFYIAKYNSNTSTIGYNLTSGGQGKLGCPHTKEQKEKISKAISKETWAFNFESGEIYSDSSRIKLANQLNNLGYLDITSHKIEDALLNKSYSSCFTFGNSKEEAILVSKQIILPKKYKLYLYNYKTNTFSKEISSLSEGENFIRSKGYKISSGHLSTAIKNNNRFIKDFIFGTSKQEILEKINTYGLISYVYNLNDNSLYRFTETNIKICEILNKMYPEIKFNQSSISRVKRGEQFQTNGFILDSDLKNLINRISKHNINCCEKIFTLAKENNYLDSQEIIEWQDHLNSISIDY